MTDQELSEIEARANAANKCEACGGEGKYLPSCSRCSDSTDDHECPDWTQCWKCKGSGKGESQADTDALVAEVRRLQAEVARDDAAKDMAAKMIATVNAGNVKLVAERDVLRAQLEKATAALEDMTDVHCGECAKQQAESALAAIRGGR